MNKTNGAPVYTELDEQRFRLWLSRLEESYKIYQEVSCGAECPHKAELLSSIKSTIQSDLEKYPSWISLQKSVPAGKIASSSNDMKMFLRHIAFPHVLQSYDKIINEICPPTAAEAGSSGAVSEFEGSVASAESSMDASTSHSNNSNSSVRTRAAASTLSVPMHTAPICTQPGSVETAVEDFFRGLSKGNGDGLVNLCKLADVHHRINRACDHDTQQVAHWIETEQARETEYAASLQRRQERLRYLRGEDEGRLIEQSVGKLKNEINVLNLKLIEAAEEEEAARKVYEAAIQKRRRAGHNIVNLEDYIDNVAIQCDLLQKINDLRVEADQYNISSAHNRVGMFQSLEKYVHSVHDQFVERRLAQEMPHLFDNLTQVFTGLASARENDFAGAATAAAASPLAVPVVQMGNGSAEHLSLYCASRVGLETIRIWKQLSLHELQPSLSKSMDDFAAKLTETLVTQRPPAVTDAAAAGVYKTSNATVVLFFDHIQHDTPEDHVEAQSRVLTCLKMLTDNLVDDPPHSLMDVDVDGSGRANRTMQLLNCNDIMSPPVWCLPLAHSPQYLAQLWRLAEEAHQGDLYVPLEFDTEWISEDPYHTSSEEEGGSARRNRSGSSSGNLMRNVELDDPWTGAMDEAQREAFTKLLTPQGVDHLVAKVIKRMDTKAAARTSRNQKVTVSRSSRNDDHRTAAHSNAGSATSSAASVERASSSNNSRVLEAPEAVAVKTPMGPGTLIQNYRRDGMVSVKLQWGAIGHYRKECVEVAGGSAGGTVDRKAERQSYSAAQAFYVNGSAGRFLHNDMELHNIMARLVTLVRVQRIIGDFVAINHANLSLYMHGRTSSGLTKTIEGTITRWVEKFDQDKLSDLLDLAEQAVSKGTPIDPQDFIKLLEKCAMPAGQVSAVKKDKDPPPAHAAKAERRVSDVHKELAKLADRPTTAPKVMTTLPSMASTPAPASAPVKVHKERSKTPTDVRTLARYTKDGEILRELMLAIMRNRKISQGSIANEYYKHFRYETSQGGVSAWFHFRGNSSTFDAMNHCALMWAEDQKGHLTAEEQATLAAVNKRMEPGQQGHQFPSHHGSISSQGATDASLGMQESSSGASYPESQEYTPVIKTEEPLGAPLVDSSSVANGVANGVHTSLPAVSSQDARADAANSVSDNEMSVDADQESGADDSDRDEGTSTVDGQIDVDVAAEPTISNGDANSHFVPLPAAVLTSKSSVSTVSELCLTAPLLGGKDSAHHETSMMVLPLGETAHSLSVSPVVPQSIHSATSNGTSADAPLPAPPVEIRTIDDLHSSVVYEMNRRKVSQSKAAVEANLRDLGMGQPALSKFLSIASINNNDRGKMFSDYMVKWVSYSRALPAAEGWDPLQAPAYRPPCKGGSAKSAAPEALPARVSTTLAPTDRSNRVPSMASDSSGGDSDGSDLDAKDSEVLTPRVSVKPDMFKPMEKLSHMRHNRNEVGEEEELTCGLCGKISTEFANNKSFHMHLAWCYRRKNQTRPPPDHMLRTTGAVVDAAADWPGNSANSKKRRPSGFVDDANKRSRPSSDLLPKPRPEEMTTLKDTYVINADSFKHGYHYDTCEVCKSHGDVVLCASCPCVYHARCTDIEGEVPAPGTWFCPKCRETGAAIGELLTEEAKSDPSLVESWILVYSDGLHRWRKAVVLALHPERRGVVLAKWWRIDNKGGKSNWLNIADAKVLTAVPEKVSMANSRTRTQIPSMLTMGSRERSQTVRFDATPDKKANARFKESSAMMHMDGETGGSVPPLVRASAAGVGGVGALRDGEYPEEKGINISGNGMSDTYISSNSLKAALCAAGSACRAVDIAICNENTNVFACTRPPGHHAGRYGCTGGCLSTGFCLLNNAAIAAIYGRVRWGLERVAVVDIDVHFGNGTAELLRNDPNAFFASVHMIYGEDNDGLKSEHKKTSTENPETKTRKPRASASLGFYPARMGLTEVTDTYVSVGVYPTQDSSSRSGARRRKKVVVASDSDSSAAEEEDAEVALQNTEADTAAEDEGEAASGEVSPSTAMDTVETTETAPSTETATSSAAASAAKSSKDKNASSSGSNGCTSEAQKRTYVGSEGFLAALRDVILPQMEKFRPQLLVISAGFDGYVSDPLGGQLCLSLEDYKVATKMLMASMQRIQETETNPNLITGKVISLLEGGYDTSPFTLGLAKCVDAHVIALQEG